MYNVIVPVIKIHSMQYYLFIYLCTCIFYLFLDNDNLSISLTHYSDLSLSLPYTDVSPDAIIGSPVWSIQLLMNGGRVTQLATPINITFPHPIEVSVCVCIEKLILESAQTLCIVNMYQKM